MNSSKIILGLTTLALLFFTACGGSKPLVVAPKKVLPTWYKTPQKTTATTLYALGEGSDKKEAIANALSMMLSTLSVSVASQYNSKTVEHQGVQNSYQTTHSNEVTTDVAKIRISNYELVEAQSMGFRNYIVQIKSDKEKLFNTLLKDVQTTLRRVDERMLSSQNYNAIKRLKLYKKSKEELLNIPATLNVMSVLKPSFNEAPYRSKIQNIQHDSDKLLSKITFSIESNRDAKKLQAPLQSGLNAEKLQVRKSSGKYHFRVKINSQTDKASSYGFTLARCAISITTQDYRGNVIASNKLNITGQSTQGYAIAKENVALKLNVIIKEEGIDKVLGELFAL